MAVSQKLEHLEPAFGLHDMVFGLSAPAHHGFLVAPGRMRQHPSGSELALEALIVDEAVDLFQDRLQVLGEAEIFVLLSLVGKHFKDHGKHRVSFLAGSAGDSWGSGRDLRDIVTLLPGGCECGRSLPMVSYPEGRSDDLIELASGRIVHPQAIRSVFNEERLIWEYQVEQLTDAHFRVVLLAAPTSDRQAAPRRIADKLASVLGSDAHIDVEFADAIDRTLGGKFAPVISRRARQRRAGGG